MVVLEQQEQRLVGIIQLAQAVMDIHGLIQEIPTQVEVVLVVILLVQAALAVEEMVVQVLADQAQLTLVAEQVAALRVLMLVVVQVLLY